MKNKTISLGLKSKRRCSKHNTTTFKHVRQELVTKHGKTRIYLPVCFLLIAPSWLLTLLYSATLTWKRAYSVFFPDAKQPSAKENVVLSPASPLDPGCWSPMPGAKPLKKLKHSAMLLEVDNGSEVPA